MLTRARMTGVVAALLAVAATATPLVAGAQGAVAPIGPDPMDTLTEPGQSVTLSDEHKITRWAHSTGTEAIRSVPKVTGRKIANLRLVTEDGEAEVYLVLGAQVDDDGTQWLHLRVMGKPNGRTGWVQADYMSQLFTVRTSMLIDRKSHRATLYRNGRRVWQAPIGVGKSSTPTPTGRFWVRELLRGSAGSAYGPWAFGTSAYSSIADWHGAPVVGIHGTNEPQLIPGAPSHGCVRVKNAAVSRLRSLMPIGTPVRII
jgi:hypothetical protein